MSADFTRSILLRVSEVEHAEISREAGEAGQSLSRFIVSRTLGEGIQAPALELARARAALQAALQALDGDDSAPAIEAVPVVEADSAPAIEAVPVVQEVEDDDSDLLSDDDPLDTVVDLSPPPGTKPIWIRAVSRVWTAWRGDRSTVRRIKEGTATERQAICRPGAIFAALHGRGQLVVGRAQDGAVVWSETLSWRPADRAATLDALQALATRDLCPSAWDEDEGEEELEVEVDEPKAPSANPFDDIDW